MFTGSFAYPTTIFSGLGDFVSCLWYRSKLHRITLDSDLLLKDAEDDSEYFFRNESSPASVEPNGWRSRRLEVDDDDDAIDVSDVNDVRDLLLKDIKLFFLCHLMLRVNKPVRFYPASITGKSNLRRSLLEWSKYQFWVLHSMVYYMVRWFNGTCHFGVWTKWRTS